MGRDLTGTFPSQAPDPIGRSRRPGRAETAGTAFYCSGSGQAAERNEAGPAWCRADPRSPDRVRGTVPQKSDRTFCGMPILITVSFGKGCFVE
jgi:hypothetical protein